MERNEVSVITGGVTVQGILGLPDRPAGTVVFAHGTGSGRLSPRNAYVAEVLQEAGLATLLIDLLTEEEERQDRATGHLRFDVGLLAERLLGATTWLLDAPGTRDLAVGYFGASTGAAAALIAAAERPDPVSAVVSRGGRPDLAGDALPAVTMPTLLVVGGLDVTVLDLNREARGRMTAPTRLEIVEGASHLFEEPGALERVAELARGWFLEHLPR